MGNVETSARAGGIHWHYLAGWMATFGMVAGYFAVYVGLLVVAFSNGQLANGLLAVLCVIGLALQYYVLARVKFVHKVGDPKILNGMLLYGSLSLLFLMFWYIAGALMHTRNEYRVFAYAPACLAVLGVAVVMILASGHHNNGDLEPHQRDTLV